jgi:hypothetical protein
MGNRQCWVCLGQGRSERSDGGFAVCGRCGGTGVCATCARPAEIDLRDTAVSILSDPTRRTGGASRGLDQAIPAQPRTLG